MRKWFWCVTTLCLAGLLAACSEEDAAKDPLDWAIDPEMQGEEREILRSALKIVVAECPALADIDWEAEAKKEREKAEDGYFSLAKFIQSNPENPFARPFIDGWTYYGDIYLDPDPDRVGRYYFSFSWTEPPGIATEASSDPAEDAKEKKPAILTRNANDKTGASFGSSGSMPWRRS